MKDRAADGLLLVDKPAGITSHTVVDRARRALGVRRIGHGGTLDPFATGLLVLLVGRATRLLPFLGAEPKVYEATIRLGVATTTDDLTGDPVAEAPIPDDVAIDRAMQTLTGRLLQRPPVFSAKQVAGVRAYSAARRGEVLPVEPVGVTVFEWRILERGRGEIRAEIHCSGGTYVRALARDLGHLSGSAAHLTALRRTRSGRFDVAGGATIEQLDAGDYRLISPARAVAQLPQQPLDDLDARRVAHGQTVPAQLAGDVAALCYHEELLAIGVRDGEQWRPKVVMRDA